MARCVVCRRSPRDVGLLTLVFATRFTLNASLPSFASTLLVPISLFSQLLCHAVSLCCSFQLPPLSFTHFETLCRSILSTSRTIASRALRSGGIGVFSSSPSSVFAKICVSVVPLSLVRFAPSLMYIATTALARPRRSLKPHTLDQPLTHGR